MKLSQSEPFIATRAHHLLELAEDYVELIAELIAEKNEAKISDLAKHFGVSHVTVIRAVERLKKKGYLVATEGHPLALTKKGATLAAFSKERHLFLLKYLAFLGVPDSVAAIDVEGMEHHISKTTMDAFKRHMEGKISHLP